MIGILPSCCQSQKCLRVVAGQADLEDEIYVINRDKGQKMDMVLQSGFSRLFKEQELKDVISELVPFPQVFQ